MRENDHELALSVPPVEPAYSLFTPGATYPATRRVAQHKGRWVSRTHVCLSSEVQTRSDASRAAVANSKASWRNSDNLEFKTISNNLHAPSRHGSERTHFGNSSPHPVCKYSCSHPSMLICSSGQSARKGNNCAAARPWQNSPRAK